MRASWILFIDKNTDKVLVVKRSLIVNNPGEWNFPGGSARKRKPKSLARKEALEEVGIKTKKIKLILKVTNKFKEHSFYIVYLPKQVGVKLNYESTKYKWVKLNKLTKVKNKHRSLKLFLKNF